VLGCERRPVSASIMSRSYFASFPVCVYKFSSHYLNYIIFIDNSLGPLARDSPCINVELYRIITGGFLLLFFNYFMCKCINFLCFLCYY